MTQPWDIYEISQNNPYLSQGLGFKCHMRYCGQQVVAAAASESA